MFKRSSETPEPKKSKAGKIRNLVKEFDAFSSDIRSKIFNHARRLVEVEKKIKRCDERLKFVDETKFLQRLKNTDKRIAKVTQRIHAEIVRNCVLSEVIRLYPDLTSQVIRLMDRPYQFFWDYRFLSVEQWATVSRSPHPEITASIQPNVTFEDMRESFDDESDD
jgi:hypothetical protein